MVSTHGHAVSWLIDTGRDFRHGWRSIRRSPLFTVVVVITLGLAIGATTTIFSLVDVLFSDLPVRDPNQLVQFVWQYPGDPPLNLFGRDDYSRYREGNTVFTDLAGTAPALLRGGQVLAPDSRDVPDTVVAEFVTGNYFSGLGVEPIAGRVLTPDDDRPDASAVAVVSESYWQRQFNRGPRVLQATVLVANVPVPIVGVVDSRFAGVVVGHQPDVWIPISTLQQRQVGMMLWARVKPGVSIEQAQSEMRALDRSRIETRAVKDPQWLNVRLTVEPARMGLAIPLTDQFGRPLITLVAFVGVLLALACANIGGLLLARGAARQHELAVRLSLGASRWRLARQKLAEAALLAALGAAAALPLAAWCGPLLLRTMIAGTRSLHASPVLQVRIDAGVLGFTMVMTFVAALLFGVVPAWSVRSTTPVTALKTGAAGGHASARWGLGDVLVVLQVLLSFALLSLLQLYGSHLWHLRDGSLGFDPRSVLVVSVDTATGRAPGAITALNQEALSRLAAIPGVQSAALSGMTPISGAAGSRFMTVEGFQEPASARRRVSINSVSANYFATLGTPLVAGRDFRASDVGPARVAIANLAMVRHYFAGTMPLGVHVQLEGDDHAPLEIIGVAADAKYADVRVPAPPTLYLFYPQVTQSPSDFSLRVGWSPSSVAAGARRVLGDVFGQDRVRRVVTLTDQVDASIVPERMLASLAGFFGGMGTLLAAVGLYGLLAFTVARRTREIGLRLALGAPTSSVLTLVIARALILVGIGVAAGLPLAIWSRHLASAMVEHLSPGGWLPLLAAALATLIAGVMGAALPARRATRVDPLIALRAD